MSHVEILVPFSLPPAELAPDLLKQLRAPALSMLVSRGRRTDSSGASATLSRALPHERWLAGRCGLTAPEAAGDDSPPLGPLLHAAHGQPPAQGLWFALHPVHVHIARDHLVLTDMRQLALEQADARTLYDIAAPLFAEAGLTLAWGEAQTWFLRADDWEGLRTASPDAATGHNIDIWMPKGPHERAWRKIQNEVQMHWHGHPVNEEREARGQRPVNSLWLWGGGRANRTPELIFSHGVNLDSWYAAFRSHVRHAIPARSAAELPDTMDHALILLDDLAPAWMTSDWGGWLAAMEALETQWFAPLLKRVESRHLDTLSILLGDDNRLLQLTVTRGALRKFWRKPGLAPLLPPAS